MFYFAGKNPLLVFTITLSNTMNIDGNTKMTTIILMIAPLAINMMEKALHMCRPYNVLGISVLENSLKEAKKKYEKELSGTDKLDV